MISDGFVDRVTALKIKIDRLERSRAPSRYKSKIARGLADDLSTLRHDMNQLMEARNEIGTEVDLRFARESNWLGCVEANMTILPGNAHLLNSRIRPKKAEKINASRLSQYNEEE